MTNPNWGAQVNPSATVHNPPPEIRQVKRLTPKQIGAIGEVILNLVLANIALAIAGVNIFGIKPFDFMRQWADDLQKRAQDAYWTALGLDDGISAGIYGGSAAYGNQTYVDTFNPTKFGIGSVSSTANTASSNSNNALNQLGQLVVNTATNVVGAAVTTVAGVGQAIAGGIQAITQAVNGFWNGVFGTNVNNKTAADMQTAAGAVTSTANTASTNANNGLTQIGEIIYNVGQSITGAVVGTATAVGQAIGGAIKGIKDTWDGFWNGVFGGSSTGKNATDVRNAAGTLVTNIGNAQTTANSGVSGNVATNVAIYNGYFGSGGSGVVAEVNQTVAAIKTKIQGGYNLQSLTFNSTSKVQVVTLRGSPTGGTFTLSYGGQTTAAIAYNATAATVQTALTNLSNIGSGNATVTGSAGGPYTVTLAPRSQVLTVFGSPTGGTFTLTYGGQTTSAIAYNATAATVQTALWNLSAIGSSGVTVTGSAGGPYSLLFASSISGVTLVTATSSLTGGTEMSVSSSYTAISATSSLTGGSSPSVLTQSTWTPPWNTADDAPKELYAVAFGSGGGGAAGQKVVNNNLANCFGGDYGRAGGYVAVQIDATTITSSTPIPYTVAAGGLGSTTGTRTSGSESSFGSYLKTQSGQYNVVNLLGYYSTPSSAPGDGGGGGWGCNPSASGDARFGSAGDPGVSSPLASAGQGGQGSGLSGFIDKYPAATKPGNGVIGGTASLTGTARAGGGGGGGGGGSYSAYYTNAFFSIPANALWTGGPGGLGGNGGFPGGGGGGGGGAFTMDIDSTNPAGQNAGNGGNGANGVIVLLWK